MKQQQAKVVSVGFPVTVARGTDFTSKRGSESSCHVQHVLPVLWRAHRFGGEANERQEVSPLGTKFLFEVLDVLSSTHSQRVFYLFVSSFRPVQRQPVEILPESWDPEPRRPAQSNSSGPFVFFYCSFPFFPFFPFISLNFS